jgi:DNA-directed RNA polymerase subunit M/transcription elongation factor TFIIS
MSSQLSFCPKCNSLLEIVKEDDEVLMKCPICTYAHNLLEGHLLRSNKLKENGNVSKLPFSMIYDDTIKHSAKIVCKEQACPSNDEEQWGNLTEDKSIRIQPDIMIINHNDPNRISTYVCRICGQVTRPT